MIKITKKAAGDRLHISDTYITNGHWAVPRVQVEPRFNSYEALGTVCSTVQLMTEDRMQTALKSAMQATRDWTVTAWLYERGTATGMYRVAVAADGARMYLSLVYCTFLGIVPGSVLYANNARNAARFGVIENAIVIMPYDDRHITELPALPTTAAEVAA